jgi:signal peptidase I
VPSTSTSNPPRTDHTAALSQATEPGPPKPKRRHTRLWRIVKSALAALFAAGCLGYALLFAFHLQPVVMLTGSMGTTIPPGSLVIDREVAPTTLKVGDMITFQKPLGQPGLDTHRIIAINRSNGHTSYQTKGDANPTPDPWTIQFQGQAAHQVTYTIPRLGWLLLFLRTPIARDLILAAVLLTLLTTILKALAAAGTAMNLAQPKQRTTRPG